MLQDMRAWIIPPALIDHGARETGIRKMLDIRERETGRVMVLLETE